MRFLRSPCSSVVATCTSRMKLRTVTGIPHRVYTFPVMSMFFSRCDAQCSSSMKGLSHTTSANNSTLHLESIGYVVVALFIGLLDRRTYYTRNSSAGVK
ncbi:hypothetical protein AVEN_191015-1 [Araneus ventricosus]|uniref:Uncharacterized protein n=1 Tax=Araneus ventricosus TaxID=182803 RepID=A0A4Y2PFG4_ARAVE|nr:hypothetical protein AVEN_191015-1 [Araneus ventricosus]